jgi:ribosomal-protein-alanine N-acetyltransferase
MSEARTVIDTPRLRLTASDPARAEVVAAYYRRNAEHFAPWDPPQPPDHATTPRCAEALAEGRAAFDAGRAHRWWLARRDTAEEIIGSVHLSGIVRGPLQGCSLGYALDARCQGQGLMHEALTAAIDEAFSARIHLHRIQAAIRPENQRSLATVQRLGFRDEGLARDYLYIAGGWRDHRIFVRNNPGFVPPEGW